MKQRMPTQAYVGLLILLGGGVLVGGEYLLVKWYPGHHQRVRDDILTLLPYHNEALGVEMKVAKGLYGKVEDFPGGVRIASSKFWSIGTSLIITSQPNPDQSTEFSPQVLSKWQTEGVTHELPRYGFEHTKIQNRDAVLIRQYKGRSMLLTARVISPDRLVQVDCSPGAEEEDLYMEACDETVRTMKLEGPEPPPTPTQGVVELTSPSAGSSSHH